MKKILVVTETPLGTPNGFGVTLACMFKNIPHQIVYTDSSFQAHGKKLGFLHAQVPYHRARRFIVKFLVGKIPEWRGLHSSLWLKRNLKEEFKAVYAFVYSTNCLKFAKWISLKKNIPFYAHVADHSVEFERRKTCQVLSFAKKLICITDEMKTKYENMLGRKDIEVIHNGAESRCFNISSPKSPPFSKNNPFVLCFLGGLFSHLHRDCIEDIFEAIPLIQLKHSALEFHIYGQLQPSNFLSDQLKLKGVKHHGIIMPLEKKYDIMERAHCFLIPSSFNPQSHLEYRYSFPTKLPEIIATGRPVLSYGPSDTSSNRILETYGLGIRIYERSTENLVLSISSIINGYAEASQDALSASLAVGHKFSAVKVRQKLSNILEYS